MKYYFIDSAVYCRRHNYGKRSHIDIYDFELFTLSELKRLEYSEHDINRLFGCIETPKSRVSFFFGCRSFLPQYCRGYNENGNPISDAPDKRYYMIIHAPHGRNRVYI